MNIKSYAGAFIGILVLVGLLYLFSTFGAYTITIIDPIWSFIYWFVIGAIIAFANKVL